MNTAAPKLTVMFAVYNVAPFLEESLRSICDQSFTDFEIIAVDDGSTDRSGEILDAWPDPRLRVIHQPNQGIAATRNRILREARGEYIAVLDPDDVNLPGRFEKEVAFLDAHPSVAIVGGQTIEISEDGVELCDVPYRPIDPATIKQHFTRRMAIVHPSSMYRRKWALDIGGYPSHFVNFSEDYAMFRQLSERHAAVNLSDHVIRYRIRRQAATTLLREASRESTAAIRKSRMEGADASPAETPLDVETLRAKNEALAQQSRDTFWRRWIEAAYYARVARAAMRGRRWGLARSYYARSIWNYPWQWLAYTGLFRAVMHVGGATDATRQP